MRQTKNATITNRLFSCLHFLSEKRLNKFSLFFSFSNQLKFKRLGSKRVLPRVIGGTRVDVNKPPRLYIAQILKVKNNVCLLEQTLRSPKPLDPVVRSLVIDCRTPGAALRCFRAFWGAFVYPLNPKFQRFILFKPFPNFCCSPF